MAKRKAVPKTPRHDKHQFENRKTIVVALVEEHEATLKRLRRKGDMIALEAANPAYETRLFKSNQVRVQGRLVGIIRKY